MLLSECGVLGVPPLDRGTSTNQSKKVGMISIFFFATSGFQVFRVVNPAWAFTLFMSMIHRSAPVSMRRIDSCCCSGFLRGTGVWSFPSPGFVVFCFLSLDFSFHPFYHSRFVRLTVGSIGLGIPSELGSGFSRGFISDST